MENTGIISSLNIQSDLLAKPHGPWLLFMAKFLFTTPISLLTSLFRFSVFLESVMYLSWHLVCLEESASF